MAGLTPERIQELLGRAPAVRVLVVGDVMLDRYITGSVDRISPEAPVPVVRAESESSAVGGAGNVAANVVALGASCSLVGCVGDDPDGSALLAALIRLGVGTEGIVVAPDRPTTVKTRIMARRQQVARVDREVDADVPPAVAEALAAASARLAGEAHVVVLEDYNKGVLVGAVIEAAMAAASSHGIPTVVDPKRRNFFAFPGTTVFKPNAKELGDALGDFVHAGDAAWMEATRLRIGCRHLLVTLGERGMALQSEEGILVPIATAARSVYDVSGAGDTVTAVVAVMLGAGASPAEAATLASHAAGVEVGKAGVATVTPGEILAHARGYDENSETDPTRIP